MNYDNSTTTNVNTTTKAKRGRKRAKKGLSIKIKKQLKSFIIFLKKNKIQSFFFITLVFLNYYRQTVVLSLKQRNFLKQIVSFVTLQQRIAFLFKEFSKFLKRKKDFFYYNFLQNYFSLSNRDLTKFQQTTILDKQVFENRKKKYLKRKRLRKYRKFSYRLR